MGAVPVRLLASGWPPAGAVVVACDVGQGDALVLPDGAGRGGRRRRRARIRPPVDGCLRRLGVRRGGRCWSSPTSTPTTSAASPACCAAGGSAACVAAAVRTSRRPARPVPAACRGRGVPVAEVGAGWTLRARRARAACSARPRPLTGTRSDPNNNTLVLRAESAACRVLLPGDAETEEQQRPAADVGPAPLRADVLKVAHHGSAYQDPAFLDAVAPGWRWSASARTTRTGIPSRACWPRLARAGARVLRTDLDGDLAVVLDRMPDSAWSSPGRRAPWSGGRAAEASHRDGGRAAIGMA